MIRTVGRYRILEPTGRKGMGTFFKAHDPILDRLVALEVISPDAGVSDELKVRFCREAQVWARLDHANIIRIFDVGEDEGRLFIVTEFLEGESLEHLIGQRKVLPLEDKLSLMIQLCDALGYLHQNGVIHLGINPGNIVVLPNGQAKIRDFGLARLPSADAGLTRTGLIMGTLRYMSPEQARGKVDHRSDIFSAGSVFYALLALRPAFPGDDPVVVLEQLRLEDPPPLTQVDPTIPPDLAVIIEGTLRKDPAERFPDIGQMRQQLEQVRRRLTGEAERLQFQVRARLKQVRELQAALTQHVGESLEDETLPLVDDRARLLGLGALDQELGSQVERLRAKVERAEALAPVVARGAELLQVGDFQGAIAQFGRILREMPEHQRALEGLRQARRALDDQERQQAGAARPVEPGARPKRYLDENVQFTVYRPKSVQPAGWYPLLAFAHLSERRPDAPADEPDPIEEVQQQARRVLGAEIREYPDVTQDSRDAVPAEGEITFVPEMPGVEFNPPRRSFLWHEPVHREEFRLRASAELDGQTARGRLTVFLGNLILAEVSLAIRVDSGHVSKPEAAPFGSERARAYRRIFASYSHRFFRVWSG